MKKISSLLFLFILSFVTLGVYANEPCDKAGNWENDGIAVPDFAPASPADSPAYLVSSDEL